MMNLQTVSFFCREGNRRAAAWEKKIKKWLSKNWPKLKIVKRNAGVVIALGGDGSILEAARRNQTGSPIVIGLNLGKVGFLASARNPEKFLEDLDKFFKGNYKISERVTIEAKVLRGGRAVFGANALNDIVVQNLLGVSEIEVNIGGHPIQYIRGSGVLIATPTGSTAYNLSARGPIVMPEIKCLIVNELFDHNVPTPSIVVDSKEEIRLKLLDFKEHGTLSLARNKKKIDVILASDGEKIFPLKRGDWIVVKRSAHVVRFAELEKNYFFKSLQEKFAFR